MAQPLANSIQFNFQKPTYCRKEKSIGLLCCNFLSLYDRDGGETIEIHDACARLGVEIRRLRDFFIILEGIGLLKKERKTHYSWKGFGVIPKTFQLLQRGGPRESYTRFEDNEFSQVSDEGKKDNRKEKCLGLLTQNFVKLFLCSEFEVISIDEAAKILHGDAHDQSTIQTRVKRLYDVANVLSSMNFIEKSYQSETRRSVFRWIGMGGNPQTATSNDPVLTTKRRTFETEPTNTSTKRRRMGDPSGNATTDQTIVAPSEILFECRSGKKVVDENDLEKGSIQNMKKHKFGSFAPINAPQDKPKGNTNGRQIRDWESLALTHRPQYQNQASRDLFDHYMGAWNSFCSQVAGQNPEQP